MNWLREFKLNDNANVIISYFSDDPQNCIHHAPAYCGYRIWDGPGFDKKVYEFGAQFRGLGVHAAYRRSKC